MFIKMNQTAFDRDRFIDNEKCVGGSKFKDRSLKRPGKRQRKLPAGKRFTLIGKISTVSEISGKLLLRKSFLRYARPFLELARQSRQLAHRCDKSFRQMTCRQLRFRIKFTNRIDRIPEELYADRTFSPRRPYIYDPASDRKLPDAVDRILPNIAGATETLDQLIRRKIIISDESGSERRHFVGCYSSQDQGSNRQHDQPRF